MPKLLKPWESREGPSNRGFTARAASFAGGSPPISPEAPGGQCPWRDQVERYHDGELDASAADAMRAHLTGCAGCAEELRELQRVSRLFREMHGGAAGEGDRVPRALLVRLHRAVDNCEADRGGMLRMAGLLSGLAASLLVIGSAWLLDVPAPAARPAQVVIVPSIDGQEKWENVAVNLRLDPLSVSDLAPPSQAALAEARVADWVLKNL